jgi:hypothetical protein
LRSADVGPRNASGTRFSRGIAGRQ